MKKSLILVGMLAIGFANAQEGNVGINTDQPKATLDVKAKTNNGSKVLELQNSANTKLVTALDNGKLGIGTDSPNAQLTVSATDGLVSQFESSHSTAFIRLMPNKDLLTRFSIWTILEDIEQNGEIEKTARTRLFGHVNGTAGNGITIDHKGKVGIANEFPTEKLDVFGFIRSSELAKGEERIVIADANGKLTAGANISSIASSTEPWKIVGTINPATANDQNIYQMGNVGIGTDNPYSKLEVKANNWFPLVVNSTNDRMQGGGGILIHPNDTSKGTELSVLKNGNFRIHMTGSGDKLSINRETGNVGIGIGTDENPSAKLHVAGNARIQDIPLATNESNYPKVLVADNNGNIAYVNRTAPDIPNATETIFSNPKVKTDVMGDDTFFSIAGSGRSDGYMRYTGQSITLPPGKWTVYHGYLLSPVSPSDINKIHLSEGSSVWARAIISDIPDNASSWNNSAISNSPEFISTMILPGAEYAFGTGSWLVENTTDTPKTYYIKVSFRVRGFTEDNDMTLFDMSHFREDYLYAMKRK